MFKKSNPEQDPRFEEKLISKLTMAAVVEQRRARRWRMLRFVLILVYIPLVMALPYLLRQYYTGGAVNFEHIGIVEVNGVIAHNTEANADNIVSGVQHALENPHSKAVMLRINSPGGSPVQSDIIFNELLRLRKLYPEKPVYAVIAEMGASGAYYIAAGAEKIYANPASIVGSIGVTSGGSFGFVDALNKLGIERRVYTSGDNKAFLDPFLPEKPADKKRYQDMLSDVHHQFINAVKKGRAGKLQSEDIFNGFMWTGQESLELGLIDGFGSVGSIARDEFDLQEFVNYTPKEDWMTSVSKKLGISIGNFLMQSSAPQLRAPL